MRKRTINITAAAEQDLVGIIEYIAADNPSAALKLADEIQESILRLEDFPESGAVPKNRRLARQEYRMLIIQSYLVFYILPDDQTAAYRQR